MPNNSPKDLNQELHNDKYISKNDIPELSEETKKEIEKKKEEIEKLTKFITKKYPFTLAIGMLPPQSIQKIEEEEPIPESEKNEKRTHVVVIVPEEQFKNILKIRKEIIENTKNLKIKLWFHIITPVDIWNFLMDSRYDLSGAIAMSMPIYDKGILGALRVAEIHKTLVLKKFEKYISCYVIAGSLVRGTATKTSDIDVFVIIDDTDVKRMPRLELREKLRGIIYQYIADAQAIAGTKNKLEPQIWLLTDFWESVKDAHPVMFTFIRDGVPLYDRGTFLPWKLLLKMGRIKPSQESIDMFMSMGDKTNDAIKRRLIDAMIDIYYGVLTPSQALLMLYGLAPPTHKETPRVFKEIFHDKEKLIEQKYVSILEKAVRLFKEYEHGELKSIKGEEIDRLADDMEDYIGRMKKLREQIEKISQKNIVAKIEKEVFELLENLFSKKSHKELINLFDKELVKKGKMPSNLLKVLKDVESTTIKFKKKQKISKNEIENARKNSTILINHIIDYGQRCDLVSLEKSRLQIVDKDKKIRELIITNQGAFMVYGTEIKKITTKIQNSTIQEFNDAIKSQKGKLQTKISPAVFEIIRKEIGDFEIII